MISETRICRACSSKLYPLLNVGNIYPSLFTDTPQPPADWPKVPLELMRCQMCGLVQLRHTFSPESLYRNYWYQSSLNASMVSSLREIVERATTVAPVVRGDTVVDIGCNDGTLLSLYPKSGVEVRRVGYDPSLNLKDKASRHCEEFINDFFSKNRGKTKAMIITAIAMFYDLEDIQGFMEAVTSWLHEDGIFIVQMTDIYKMLSVGAFDNIVHEHLEYWSLKSLIKTLGNFGLMVFDVRHNDVNGGSLMAFCCWKDKREPTDAVDSYLMAEEPVDEFGWDKFQAKIHMTTCAVKVFCQTASHFGKRVVGLGASTKANTLLQLAEVDSDDIAAIGEIHPDKIGKFTVGTGIPIKGEDEVMGSNPDAAIVFPWHFHKSFSNRPDAEKLIFPLPKFGTRMGLAKIRV